MDRDLVAIDQREAGKLHAQARGAGYASGFLRFRDTALDGLAAVGDNDAVHDDGVSQRSGKCVARLVMVRRKQLIDTHRYERSGCDGKLGRDVRRRWWRGLRIARIAILR